MEQVLRGANKIVLDKGATGGAGGSGVLPYLPLPGLRPMATPPAAPATTPSSSTPGAQR
jgi:membrane protease subunit HflK